MPWKKRSALAAFAVFLLLALGCLFGCAGAPPASLEKVVLRQGGGVFPPSYLAYKEITLYPDGTGALADHRWPQPDDPESADTAVGVYEFNFPTESFTAIRDAVKKSRFFSLPEDLGVFATDVPYDSITVEDADGKSHTSGGAGLWAGDAADAKKWNAVRKAIGDALDQAYFDFEQDAKSIESVSRTNWIDSAFLKSLREGETFGYSRETIDSLLEQPAVWRSTYYSDGRVVRETFAAPADMNADYPPGQLTLVDSFEYRVDPAAFADLKQALIENGFFGMPGYVAPVRDGKPMEIVGGTYAYFTATLDGQTHTVGTILAKPGTPEGLLAIDAAFSQMSAAQMASGPLTAAEVLTNWDQA